MKSVAELEELRSRLIDNFYAEANRLAQWDSDIVDLLPKKNKVLFFEKMFDPENSFYAALEAHRTSFEAIKEMIDALSPTISALNTMIKQLAPKEVKSAGRGVDALSKMRGKTNELS